MAVGADKLVAEFVGTFLLIFTVGCNVVGKGSGDWAGVSIASVLTVAIYSFGGISGGNFNPAVSIMLGIIKTMNKSIGMEWADVAMYCVTQIAAGILAGFSYCFLYSPKDLNLAVTTGYSVTQACAAEFFYTFMLTFVVANVAVSPAVQGNSYYGLAIGFVVVAGAYGAGAISGGCFNPAVAIGLDASSYAEGFGLSLIYAASEIAGCAVAAVLYKFVRPADFGGSASDATKLISEFLGTYMLVLTVGLNVWQQPHPAAAFSIAASLMCMIYALGDVSGANFNPAVSLAIFVYGASDPKTLVSYIVAQILGGIAAGFTYATILSGSIPLAPGATFTIQQASIAELVFTLVLCLVVLHVAVCPQTKDKTMFGFAIGACVTVGGFAIGNISGGSLNPAVSFGLATSSTFGLHATSPTLINAAIYSGVEFVGAILAAVIAKVTLSKYKAAGAREKPLLENTV